MTKSLPELIVCAEREVALRRRVYARWVSNGTMTQAKAEHEIQCMESIAEFLKSHLSAPAKADLFEG